MTDMELVAAAKKAAENSYSPYSHFTVGAALECGNGTVYTGCNIENAAYGSTICAERTAMCKAISEGERSFSRIAIWGCGKDFCWPCGACRQFLAEFGDMTVLTARSDGEFISKPLSELLPFAFDAGNMDD